MDWSDRSGSIWSIAKGEYYIGNLLGLLDSIYHFKIFNDAADSGNKSFPSKNGVGLKTASFNIDGIIYNLTQDSPYNECDYTDQFDSKWSYEFQEFHHI